MTIRTTTTFTCDRCGAIELEQEDNDSSWVSLNTSMIDQPEQRIDLCPPCWLAFKAWVKRGGTLELQPIPPGAQAILDKGKR